MRTWLRKARKAKKISAAEMATAIGCAEAGYYRIEVGNRQERLELETAAKIAEALGMTLDEILAEESAEKNGQRV